MASAISIIDTHSHLNFNAFKEDADLVIKKTLAEGIQIINVGTKYATSQKAVQVAQQYKEGVYAAIGLHPMYAAAEFIKIKTEPDEGEFLLTEQEFDKEALRKLALSDRRRVVAIGEVGLDYYYKPKSAEKLAQFKEKQKQVFFDQLDLADELNLPVILHCRMAHDDVIAILAARKKQGKNGKYGVVHCFTGTWEQAQKYMDMGYYLGINGIIFKFNIDEVIRQTPLEKLVVETDCPYLTPPQEIGKRNEPLFIRHTIQKIAELKGVTFDQVASQTTDNARQLFGL